MRSVILAMVIIVLNSVQTRAADPEEIFASGKIIASIPYEDEEIKGFQLLVNYKGILHVCIFSLDADDPQLEWCELKKK